MQFFVCLIVHTQNSLYVIQLQRVGEFSARERLMINFIGKEQTGDQKFQSQCFGTFVKTHKNYVLVMTMKVIQYSTVKFEFSPKLSDYQSGPHSQAFNCSKYYGLAVLDIFLMFIIILNMAQGKSFEQQLKKEQILHSSYIAVTEAISQV